MPVRQTSPFWLRMVVDNVRIGLSHADRLDAAGHRVADIEGLDEYPFDVEKNSTPVLGYQEANELNGAS